jgi:squalene-associated FAD-dependent desaturase
MTTIIVGGGWSGLAAAVKLAEQGEVTHVFESAKQLGGRARNVQWHDITVDNGQHLMIGAYTHMLDIMKQISIEPNTVFTRKPMDISIYDPRYSTLKLSAISRLPWPLSLAWNIFKSAGLNSLLDIARLQKSTKKVLSSPDITVKQWLINTQQSTRLIKQLWEPLCLATLNTHIESASAHVLAAVLRDSLGQSKEAADLLIPKVPLGDVFPTAAKAYIEQHQGQITLQSRIKDICIDHKQVTAVVTDSGDKITADNIIIATSPSHCFDLVSKLTPIIQPDESPICTVYLQYDQPIKLPTQMVGLSGSVSQWVFDRSSQHNGIIAIVISAKGTHLQLSKSELIDTVRKEIYVAFPTMPEHITDGFVIREKRATFNCSVENHQNRPTSKTPIKGLWLAGDFIHNAYPATLEGAIRNGEQCAFELLANKHKVAV